MARQHQPRDPGYAVNQAAAYAVPDGYTLLAGNDAILGTDVALPAEIFMPFKWQIDQVAETNICRAPKPIDFNWEGAARRQH